jgi:hypothetical protein
MKHEHGQEGEKMSWKRPQAKLGSRPIIIIIIIIITTTAIQTV